MRQAIKKISLLSALSISIILSACGGGGSGSATGDNFSFNGAKYPANGSTVLGEGFLIQTSPDGYQYDGQTAVVFMADKPSGNELSLQVTDTVDGWPGTYSLYGGITSTRITDKSVPTGGNMQDLANGSGTGGSITVNSFGVVGQQIAGTFNVNLCDMNAVCSASIKNYTGTFSVHRTANYGSIARSSIVSIPVPTPTAYADGIHPATGKNYYTIPTNATGGTLTLTLTPTVDVNMAVYTDAGFATPATCDVPSTLNVVGSGVETCAITVTANQKIYLTVSQAPAATFMETYTLNVAE